MQRENPYSQDEGSRPLTTLSLFQFCQPNDTNVPLPMVSDSYIFQTILPTSFHYDRHEVSSPSYQNQMSLNPSENDFETIQFKQKIAQAMGEMINQK